MGLNPYSKPFNCKYYLVPIINKETFFKYLKYLVKIGVLTLVKQNQYGTPIFIIHNKEGTVRFIRYYRKLNQKLVRMPYSLPRTGDTMQQLEGFQYVNALDLNMGYYIIC